MDTYLRLFVRERLDLCDLLATLSEDDWSAATLDQGWTVADLAAHIVVRERYPLDLARAILLKGRFGPDQDALLAREQERGPAALIAALRTMPTLFFRLPGPIAMANLAEAYIHHEDVRRGALQRPRVPSADLQRGLWESSWIFSGRGLRRVPEQGTLTLVWPDHDQRTMPVGKNRRLRTTNATATLSGEPGELLLWLTGRKAAARVQLDGTPALVAALREAPLNV